MILCGLWLVGLMTFSKENYIAVIDALCIAACFKSFLKETVYS